MIINYYQTAASFPILIKIQIFKFPFSMQKIYIFIMHFICRETQPIETKQQMTRSLF